MEFEELYASILEAYYDCRKGKRSTPNCLEFETDAMRKCFALATAIYNGTYDISWSICFIVNYPVKREIFAANFKDRIVHHWIGIRLEPLFEKYFYDSMTSNRKNKGTIYAIKKVYNDIKECSNNYTEDCYIYKFDLKGFFMSIDRRILNEQIQKFIDINYDKSDKQLLKKLLKQVIDHCPQNKCTKRSRKTEWDTLDKDKSLFGQDNYHGLAVGNLTSQMLANFLLHNALTFIYNSGFKFATEYVDDFIIIHKNKQQILNFIPKLRKYLKSIGIKLHPKKSYIQHYTKGVVFLGTQIKPHRLMIGNRIRKESFCRITTITDLKQLERSVNSYIGLIRHCAYKNYEDEIINLIKQKFPHGFVQINDAVRCIIYE